MENSHGLMDGMVVMCKRWYYDILDGDAYFEMGKRYTITTEGMIQTTMDEIFFKDGDDIKYIYDVDFLDYFEIDKKYLRKEKMKEINSKIDERN